MKRSSERILLSHAGSLHRPSDLRQMIVTHPEGQPFDATLASRASEAVADVVRKQAENGVDVVNGRGASYRFRFLSSAGHFQP